MCCRTSTMETWSQKCKQERRRANIYVTTGASCTHAATAQSHCLESCLRTTDSNDVRTRPKARCLILSELGLHALADGRSLMALLRAVVRDRIPACSITVTSPHKLTCAFPACSLSGKGRRNDGGDSLFLAICCSNAAIHRTVIGLALPEKEWKTMPTTPMIAWCSLHPLRQRLTGIMTTSRSRYPPFASVGICCTTFTLDTLHSYAAAVMRLGPGLC